MEKITRYVEDVLIVAGVGLGLAQIEQILGIVLLAFQVILILFRAFVKIRSYLKDGKTDKAIEEAKKTQEEIRELTGRNKDGKKDE